MAPHQSLLGELDEVIRSGSRDKRIVTLRRITDLFLVGPAQLNAEQIGVFDNLLTHLVERVETKARAELAMRLAPIEQAPNDVLVRLACDDEITVAGPVLKQSKCLRTTDLVDIARQKSQAHLLAIAGRDRLEGQLTDVLVDRGNRDVVHLLAANAGAEFSHNGYSALVKRAGRDESLTEKLGRRLDIPLQLFRELLLRATETVRARLMALVSEDKQEIIRRVLANVSGEIDREAPMTRDVAAAQHLVQVMQEAGRLNEPAMLAFARQSKFEEVIAGLAVLGAVPFDLIERLMQSDHNDALLVPCKAAGFSWTTVRAILELRNMRHGAVSEYEIENSAAEFKKLSRTTAGRVLRFWQVRQTTQAQIPGAMTG
jgi:uncharacterized protein (DUF2336 family)